MKRAKRFFKTVLVSAVAVLCACSTPDVVDPETTAPERLYNRALDLLVKKREYTLAASAFDEIDRFYPYSRWAPRAQIMQAFTCYVKREYDDAEQILDRFLQLYPGNSLAPYAYYLKALSLYAQLSDTDRDQQMTERTLAALSEVIRRFPDTPYAADAERKIVLATDYLAAKQVKIGVFYLKRNEHIAAMNRFADVVRNFQQTAHVQEALYRLTETYLILGLDGEARKSAAVLGYNYPSSPWYDKAYALMKKYDPAALAAQD